MILNNIIEALNFSRCLKCTFGEFAQSISVYSVKKNKTSLDGLWRTMTTQLAAFGRNQNVDVMPRGTGELKCFTNTWRNRLVAKQTIYASPAEPGHQTVSSAFYTENIVLGEYSWKML